MNYNICGKILKPHGLKGEVKVLNSSDFPRFKKNKIVYLKDDDYKALQIKEVKEGVPLIVSFKGYDNIDKILPLVGKDLYAMCEDSDLGPNEYYYSDLIGKDIYNQNNELRARVIDIRELPQGKYLVCIRDGKNKLIPFNEFFIKDVLVDRIIINEIDGLL